MFGDIEGAGFEVLDERFERCFVGHVAVERLWTGGRWLEGPAWFAAGRYLVFSDIPDDRIMRYDDTSGMVSVFRAPANNANGNTVDTEGRLVTCEHRARRVTRTEHDGSIAVIADRFEGKRLNSPNDVVVHSDGTVWFTDPPYGIATDYEGDRAEQEIEGCHVYRADPATGAVTRVVSTMAKPNGLAFSPDETILYVGDTGVTHQKDGRGTYASSLSRVPRSTNSASSRPARLACSTDSGWIRLAASGLAPAMASIASTPTAR